MHGRGNRFEVLVDGFVIDIVRTRKREDGEDLLIEIPDTQFRIDKSETYQTHPLTPRTTHLSNSLLSNRPGDMDCPAGIS
jgi:hypothetical protein